VDHVDGQLVLVAVGGRRQQRRRQPLVAGGVAAPGGGAGHGVGPHDVAGHGDEQLGAGGDEAPDADDVAAGEGGAQPLEDRPAVERHVGGDVDAPGEDDLLHLAGPDGGGGRRHELAPPLGGVQRLDRVALRLAVPAPGTDEVAGGGGVRVGQGPAVVALAALDD